jgi:fermentation-respiration switch protein FrsA (DUF1100 family)
MRLKLPNKALRQLLGGIAVLAFAARALVPQGFMPASDGSLRVTICPEGAPVPALLHGGTGDRQTSSHNQHCAFGSASTGGLLPQLPLLAGLLRARPTLRMHSTARAVRRQLSHLPYARGPPSAI